MIDVTDANTAKVIGRCPDGSVEDMQKAITAGKNTVIKEPIGVVGAITPWNAPLNQIGLKVPQAILCGCTVVLKPSEVTPIVAKIVADAIAESGLPPGVFNMVVGKGDVIGEVMSL